MRSFGTLAGPGFVGLAIFFGGASSAGSYANGLLQFVAAGIVARSILMREPPHNSEAFGWSRSGRAAILCSLLLVAYLLATLIPLPAQWVLSLPGRGEVAQGYRQLVSTPAWLPLSLDPDGTVRAIVSMLPAFAALLLGIEQQADRIRATYLMVVALTLMSILLGAVQRAGGAAGALYLYDMLGRGGAVGLFANRNHLATLCLMAAPMIWSLAIRERARQPLLPAPVAMIVTLFLLTGIVLAQSVAGWLLAIPTLAACAFLALRGRPAGASRQLALPGAFAAIAVAAALPLVLVFATPIAGNQGVVTRHQIMLQTVGSIRQMFPWGSGFGSFKAVYASREPVNSISPVFVNHAHNDYLELLLEGGVPVALLVVSILLLFGWRVVEVWRPGSSATAYQRAAAIAVSIALLHSLVDYPLRTGAIAVVAAMCCAILFVNAQARRHIPETNLAV